MSFAKESIRTLFVRIIIIVLNLICGIINARWLGATGLGVFTLFAMIPMVCFRFSNLGIGSGLSFFVAQKKLSVKQAMLFMWGGVLVLSLVCCSVMIMIRSFSYFPWYDLPVQSYFLSLVLIPLAFMQNFLTRIIAGKLQIIDLNIADFIGAVNYLLALILFVICFNLGVTGAISALIANRCTVLIILLTRYNKNDVNSSATQVEHLKEERVTFLKLWGYGKWNYLIMLNRYLLDQIPVFVIKYYTTSNEAIGLFSVARGVNGKIQIIPDTFAAILFPFNAASKKTQAVQRTNRVTRSFFSLMIFIVIFLYLFIKPLILLVYGINFIGSVPIFYALLPLIICFPLYKLQNVHIAAVGDSKRASLISITALPLCITLTFLLVPVYGAVGASLAVSTTYLFLFILSIFIYGNITKSSISEMLLLNISDLKFIKQNVLNLKR